METEAWNRDTLTRKGKELFGSSKRQFVEFTDDREANDFLNDIERFPHAFALGCIMDQQRKTELAWLIPFRFKQKLGDFEMKTLASLSEREVQRLMTKPEPLHRFPDRMSKFFFLGVKRIVEAYKGDASAIWAHRPSSAALVYRFLEFDGVGPKIATMAANILARDFKVLFADYYSIDISADIHVRRVFSRLGFTPKDATVEQIIFKARALSPEFPGLLDLPTWEIGRTWCKPKRPICENCYMRRGCPTAHKQPR